MLLEENAFKQLQRSLYPFQSLKQANQITRGNKRLTPYSWDKDFSDSLFPSFHVPEQRLKYDSATQQFGLIYF